LRIIHDVRPGGLDLLSTEQVLTLYERLFGKLDGVARRRIADTAQRNGWDKSWANAA